MKTLDEVIKACEETVSDVDRGVDIEGCYLGATETRDALHYLKEYRRYQNTPSRNGHMALVDFEESQKNEPLSWDELRTMEEKPVWLVNTATEEAEWVFVGEWLDDDEMRICRMWRDYAQYISREFYGNIWKAYRKEI